MMSNVQDKLITDDMIEDALQYLATASKPAAASRNNAGRTARGGAVLMRAKLARRPSVHDGKIRGTRRG